MPIACSKAAESAFDAFAESQVQGTFLPAGVRDFELAEPGLVRHLPRVEGVTFDEESVDLLEEHAAAPICEELRQREREDEDCARDVYADQRERCPDVEHDAQRPRGR